MFKPIQKDYFKNILEKKIACQVKYQKMILA